MKKPKHKPKAQAGPAEQGKARRAHAWETTQRLAERINRKLKGKTATKTDEEIFFLRMEHTTRRLDREEKRINQAARNNDERFFVRLGKVLDRKPKNPLRGFSKLEKFLVDHWAEPKDELPAFCNITDPQILEHAKKRSVCCQEEDVDTLKKTRQRLGLVRSKRHGEG